MNYAEKYNHKIKRVDELADIIGAFPRHERVIMCMAHSMWFTQVI